MFSCVSVESPVSADHPVRKLRVFRWFVGQTSYNPVGDHSTFSFNRGSVVR